MITTQEDRLKRIYGESNVRQSKKPITTLSNVTISLIEDGDILCNPTGFEVYQDRRWYSVYIDTSGRYHLR